MIFALFKAFTIRFWHQTLAATTGSIGARRSHKNLHAHNLHTSYFNGICHGDFGAACSMWEIRAEIYLGQKLYRLRWGPYSILFHAGAASFRSTRGIQGHQHKQIYSIIYINEISVEMSKFVPCRFRAPSSRAKARTHARCCQRSLPIAWEGFSTISSAHRVSIQRNSMPAINQLLLPKFLSTYFPYSLDSAPQILHRGEEPDPEASADGSHRQSWMWIGVN